MADPQAVLSISQLNRLTRQALEREFPLCWVTGEVSNLTRAASGHVYFTLKDVAAQVRCVMFRMRAQLVPWRLENGQQIEARALVSLYEPRGDFQLTVEAVRRAGLGRLFEEFSRLKEKLLREGLFAPERKRPIPRFPRQIGIISSPQAAALHDVLVALGRRAPHLGVILYPTQVQGETAAAGIANAIKQAGQRNECDVLLLVRGGGSIEDLWAFNEEIVARAIAGSGLPIISGVGHETDTTIIDFVADLRAATPTAAAELATQGWHEIKEKVAAFARILHTAMGYRITQEQQRLDHYSLRLTHPATRLRHGRDQLNFLGARLHTGMANQLRQQRMRINALDLRLSHNLPHMEGRQGRISLLAQRLKMAMLNLHQQRQNSLDNMAAALAHLNPHSILARGFAIVRADDGKVVSNIKTLHPGASITLELSDGQAIARILATHSPPGATNSPEPD
ncbi:MAG: exodeoxyribonuclease VII large subunit [Rugosibacter sp.]